MLNNNYVHELFEEVIKSSNLPTPYALDKKLILYGAGNMGKLAKDFLDAVNITIDFVLDKNIQNAHTAFKQTKLFHPEETTDIKKEDYLVAVSIMNNSFNEIQDYLKELGFIHIIPFYDLSENYHQLHPLRNGWFLEELTKEDIHNINYVLCQFSDDASPLYYLQFLYWRRLRIEKSFTDAPINIHNRFFIPEIVNALNTNEVYLDCGSHHAEVIQKFLNIVSNQFKKVYAIEPDQNNLAILNQNLKKLPLNDKNFTLYTFCIDNHNNHQNFATGYGYASKVTSSQMIYTKVVDTKTIDNLKLEPTFIKMHLEGGEYNALLGSLNTLKKNRPIICITTYHNKDGVWKIPLLLKKHLTNYDFLFRLHSWCGTGAVLYAIPKERRNNG